MAPISTTDACGVVPRSHLGGIYCPEKGGEKWLNYGDSHITRFPRGEKPVPVVVKRGETVFFGGNLVYVLGRTARRIAGDGRL